MRRKNVIMGPAGPESKNEYAGEGPQQITRPDAVSRSHNIV
jgi:hypothetical protein